MNFNKAIILGNVTKDPEVRALPSGQQVTNFSIATNRYYTATTGEKKEEAEFHNIVCFGKLADITSRYIKKGSLILIEGRIKTRTWMNQQGVKQYKTEIIAESMQMGPRGAGTGGTSFGGDTGYQKSSFQQQPSQEPRAEEIPIIEENYNPAPADSEPENKKSIAFEDSAADEIDVKDIPF